MNETVFWSLLERLDWKKSGDDEAVIEPVVRALAKLGGRAVLAFEDHLAEKLHALDTEAHAREIGADAYRGPDAHFSPDAFLYARCVVVANGRELFESVLATPSHMPKDMEFEALLTVGAEAYQRATGEELEHVPSTDYETFSNVAGWR